MSLIRRIRYLRWLPRAALAVFVLATLQTTLLTCAMAMSSNEMSEHCAFCPPAPDDGNTGGCVLAHAPNDASTISVNQVAHFFPIMSAPLYAFEYPRSLSTRTYFQAADIPPPLRPLHLTHCVQLK
ncbi:MAG TPA: hypothetical protein VET48_06740 [Steroidobacteraceae bacterium]|nr:hypothetical protein [Steroidobacteraceae bacterium]